MRNPISAAISSSARWLQRRRIKADDKHRSGWDIQGRDVLAEMLNADRTTKRRRLP